jgi:hypothetical protein
MGWLRRPFLRAVDFIHHFILSNGDTLYVGRGQEQSFGYGTLLYCLAEACRMTRRSEYLSDLARVWSFVAGFQREDGSFPLVFNGVEEVFPEIIDTKDACYPGWYAYNNYFDYLPFFGTYLARTAEVLAQCAPESAGEKPEKPCDYEDERYRLIRRPRYTAVLALPGGYWTNDMPFPYVCLDGKPLFPCYGGEQFVPSLYSLEGIPLPWAICKGEAVYFRDALNYRWDGNRMIGEGHQASHTRTFEFFEDGFDVVDHVVLASPSAFDALHLVHYLFFSIRALNEYEFDLSWKGPGIMLKTSVPCSISDKTYYCALGPMSALQHSVDFPDNRAELHAQTRIQWS